MRRIVGLLVIVLLLATAAAATAETSAAAAPLAVVRIPARADVVGPDILLGDIAEVETADVELARKLRELSLGRAAIPGQTRDLTLATIRVRMRQQSLPEKEISLEAEHTSVSVLTRAQTVSGDTIAEAAEAAIVAQGLPNSTGIDAAARPELVLLCPAPGALTVADGEVDIRTERVMGTPPGSVIVPVDVFVDGTVERTVMVRCDARVVLDVVVTTSPLQRHDVLDAGNVAVERREFASLPRGLLSSAVVGDDAVNGQLRATRPLTAGTVLTESMVETVPVVFRGQPVQIVAATARIHVAAPGVALEDGRIGDLIRVENSTSGHVIRARVTAAGIVEAVL